MDFDGKKIYPAKATAQNQSIEHKFYLKWKPFSQIKELYSFIFLLLNKKKKNKQTTKNRSLRNHMYLITYLSDSLQADMAIRDGTSRILSCSWQALTS